MKALLASPSAPWEGHAPGIVEEDPDEVPLRDRRIVDKGGPEKGEEEDGEGA